ncbi:hypothetical protein EVAR_90151_1 [Eumeta japonica]|uniref:Uncharacterized protein n=1 Tax=Eumeta variegata TaxID=151549 RepID=A0A4C1Z6L8_EUMVA|nr:hypothetical protein EVAR_90151_1 [Eumeta japonica]
MFIESHVGKYEHKITIHNLIAPRELSGAGACARGAARGDHNKKLKRVAGDVTAIWPCLISERTEARDFNERSEYTLLKFSFGGCEFSQYRHGNKLDTNLIAPRPPPPADGARTLRSFAALTGNCSV